MVDERSLLRDALRRATGEATLWDIRKNFESRIAKGEFIRVSEPGDDSLRRSFTTARMLAFEQDNIARMRSGQGLESPLVRSGTIRQSSAELGALSESQRKAVREVLESHDRITGFQGVAGSGKTTTLRAIRNAAEREGYAVEGFAPTSRAAHRLEEAGISCHDFAKILAPKASS